jgi:hypothetical protein
MFRCFLNPTSTHFSEAMSLRGRLLAFIAMDNGIKINFKVSKILSGSPHGGTSYIAKKLSTGLIELDNTGNLVIVLLH